MEKIQIMTDSASDISVEDEKKYDLSILPFQVSLGGQSYTSRVDFNNEQFYELMAQHDEIPVTSQITPFEFIDIYRRQAESGVTDLILVLINSHGSATYENSLMAVKLFFEEYPEYQGKFRVHSFDGVGYTSMYGMPVVRAAQMLAEGANAEAITAYLRETLPQRQIYFGLYTLKYAAKSGRIPSAAALLGNTLNIKPVMKIADNEITTAVKCRGEKKLIAKLAEMSVRDMEPGTPYEVIYGSDPLCRDEMAQAMTELTGYGPAAAYQIGAAIAANAGPKVAGVSFTKKG